MVAIVDYGVGNLFSLLSSLAVLGVEAELTSDAARLSAADRIILPGVGAFADAAQKLRTSGLAETVCELAGKGKPLLGICLGMQLLFERSYEYGEHPGLGLLQGSVKPLSDLVGAARKVPHMGWNSLEFRKNSALFRNIQDGDQVYFVHSYYAADCDESVSAVAEYGAKFTAAVERENVFGCQFPPEKSGKTGLAVLRAFCEVQP